MALKRILAYTLLEVLVTVAVIGGVASGTYLVVSHLRESSAKAKLEQDVAAVNRALQVYMTHGGKVPAGLTGDQVLARLRREAANPRIAGIKGSLIDPRMTIRWQGSSEAAESSLRAYWDDSAKKFIVAESGANPGVKEFYTGDMPEPLPMGVDEDGHQYDPNKDDRETAGQFAAVDKWVWDYNSSGNVGRDTPDIVPTAGMEPDSSGSPTDANAIPLDPPLFSIPTGRFDISWFPGTVTLSLPPSAPANVAEIYYHVTGGPWQKYTSAISVEAGTTITAKTITLDPDHFEDSATVSERYDLTSLKLEITASFPKSNYNYRELGGAMHGGLVPPAPPHGLANVTNLADVPVEHITSAKFNIFWTFDGSDPGQPGNAARIAGSPFGGNYEGTQIPIMLNSYAPAGTAKVRVRAVAIDTELFRTSDEVVIDLGIEKLTLPATSLSVSNDAVVMTPVADSNVLPANTRVFFTDNGSDPGDNAGEPSSTSAILYSAPVTYPAGLTEYTARTYPPADYKLWFTTGEPSAIGTGTTPDGFYFAINGSDRKLYQFDSGTGNNIIRTSECLYTPAAIAFLAGTNQVYYLESSSGNWNMGRYDLATGTHAPAGKLTDAGMDYVPAEQPKNLVGYNNSAYFIAEDTDDLVRIDFNSNGTIRAGYKFADIAEDLIAFHDIGDIAADTTGTLFISAQNAWATFNLKSMNGFTVPVNNPSSVWSGLVTASGNQMLGVSSSEPDKFYALDKAAGSGGSPLAFSPARNFQDFAGPLSPVPFQMPPGHYALSPGTDDILRLNLDSGRQYIFSSNLGMQPTALAADNTAGVLYAVGQDPANASNVLLKQVNISTGDITELGSLTAPGLEYRPADAPKSMVWYAGALYYLATGGDDLVKTTIDAGAVAQQTQVADILDGVSIHPILGTVDAMTIGPDGQLYLASSDHHVLVSYDLANRDGFNVIRSTPEASYKAITYRADQQMFGVPSTSSETARQLFTIDDNNGNQALARSVVPPVEISDITGLFDGAPTPVNAEFFAVDGVTTRIYRFDPATGLNAVLTAGAPWNMGAVAYDGENQRVYYVNRTGTQIGSYSIGTGTHSIVGDLNQSGLTYRTSSSPANLTFFNGALYFVAPSTDDLIRVDIAQSNTVADAWKEADLNGNASIGAVGDLAVDGNGVMYLSAGNSFVSYDLRSMSGYTVLSSGQPSAYGALFTSGGDSLFGITENQAQQIVAVSTSGTSVTPVSSTSPARNFIDAASAQQRVNVTPASGAYYASATGKNTIYSLDLATGALRPVTATCPVQPEALAHDTDNRVIYYTENTNSSSNIGLYQYDLRSQRHTYAGNLAAGSLGYSITTAPHNLVYFAGSLYTIPSGDDIVRLNFTAGVVSSLTKFADISGNTRTIGNAGAFTVDNTGMAWVSRDSGNLLAKFNFYTRTGYTEVNTSDARMTSLVFNTGNSLYGTHNSSQSVLQLVSQSNGSRSANVNVSPSLSIRDITGNNSRPQPVLPQCYAVGGDNTSIYRFDPATGVTYTVTSSAPFTLSSLARDPVNNVLYYLENSASNWRLGRYAVSSGTHTVLATIGNQVWNYPTLSLPSNLYYYGGHLYYIASGSDDLVQIGLNSAGTAVTGVTKAADITDDSVNLGVVGDVAVDIAGRAWVATGNSVVGYFSMVTLSGYTQLSSSQPNYNSLIFTTTGSFYGSHSGGDSMVYSVDGSTGAATLVANTFPQITFWDMAGHETSVPYSRSNSLWAVAENTGRLGEFVNWNLPNVAARAYGPIRYLSGGVVTSFTGAYNFESLAISQSGTAYFVRNSPTVIDGVTYKRPLFTFETGTLTWGSTPTVPVASFVGDLEQALSVLGPVGEAVDTDDVAGLAIGPDQRLWVLFNDGTGSNNDYLFRINSFSITPQGALNNVSLIGPLTGAGDVVNGGQDMVYNGNTLYVADDTDDEIYTVNPATAAITGVHSADTPVKYEGLAMFAPTGELVGSSTDSGTPDAESIRRIRAGNSNDTTRFNYSTLSAGLLTDIEGVSFSSGSVSSSNAAPPDYFAINRTNSIFRVNPQDGIVTTVTSSAPFTLDAVAYNATDRLIYYVQNSNTTIQLGQYNLAAGTHTVLGDLKTVGTYRPVTRPQHLIYYQGELFYISGNGVSQTFLVRVRISPTAILAQDTLVRLSATNNWTVTAAALDNAGMLYFREGTNLRAYDLRRLGNLAAITSTSAPFESILFAAGSGTFHAARSSTLTSIESLNLSTGVASAPVVTSPAIQLYDITGAHSAPAQLWVNTNYYAVGGNNQDIYVIDTANAANSLKTTTSLMNSIAAIAADPAGDRAYYIQQGSPYALAVYDRNTGNHTLLAQLASTGTVRPSVQPDNLTWFNGHLYWLQSNTDNLYKIELKPDGSFSDTFLVADIAGNDESAFGTVGDLVVDSNGTLFISGSNRFARFNLTTMSGYATIALNPAFVWNGLMVDGDGLGLFGVKSTEPGNLYSVNALDGSGTLIGAFDAVRSIADLASPQVPVSSVLPGQRYFISQNSTAVHRIDLATGRSYRITSQIPNQPAGIAHDFTNNMLYLAAYTGSSLSAPGTIRLVSYNLATGMPSVAGELSSGWSFNATAMPQALIYAQNALYYVHPQSDDLIKVTLTGGVPTAQAKVADIAANANLGDVSALTVSPDGALYISRMDGELLAKYNFSSLTGYDAIRTVPKANYHGLTYDDAGILHGVFGGEESNLYTVNLTTGASTWKVASSNPIFDITGLNTDILPAFSRSLWAIARSGTNAQLVEVKNYDQPTSRTAVNWGNITYYNGSTYATMPNSSIQIYGLALSSSGVGYFVATGTTTISGVNYSLGLYRLDLGTLQAGVAPRVTFLGDLKPRLDALSPAAGTSEGRWVTGLTIDPVSGKVYGMLLDGTSGGADKLFTINSLLKGSGNALIDLSLVGTMSGTASIAHGKSLIFDRNGTLYAADYNDYTVDTINPATGADLGTFSSSSDGSARYSAMAVDPVSGAVIGTEFSTYDTRVLVAGSNNDPLSFNFSSALGVSSVYAMSFLTWPAVLPETPPAVYYAVNGTTTLYSFSATSGSTSPLTPAAPFQAKSVAYDPQNRSLYYIENVASNFRLARYDLNASTHTILGNLDVKPSGTWAYDPSARPNNLEFSGGSLYYVHPNSDDLVRVMVDSTSILEQLKVADLTGNASNFGGAVTELTIAADGVLWISAVNGLYKYNLSLLTGFSTVAAGTQFSGVFFDQSGNDLYGTTFSQQTTVHSVNKVSGVMTPVAVTAPSISFDDFGSYPPVPPAPVGTYYAVNGTRTLYLMDQLTGGVSAANAGAPYEMSAVAYDVDSNLVYYVEAGTDTWRLGRYNPATGVHTDLGRAPESGAYASPSGTQPNNLFVFNSQVYYIAPGTDDLMRIDINAAGNALLYYYKVADITNNTVSWASVGDVAVSSAGLAFFSTPVSIARFNLRSMSGYAVVTASPAGDWRAMLMGADNLLYGVKAAEPSRIYRINQTNGTQTLVSEIAAGLEFADLAGRHPRVTPQPAAGQVYMAVSSSPSIHLIHVTTGTNRMLTASAPFAVGAVAYDYDSNAVFYTEASDSSFRLGRFDLRSSAHAIVADLAAEAWDYPASARINNLIYSNGDLYYIHKNTDDLVRVGLNNGAVSDQSLFAHITNNLRTLGDIGATAIDENGYLFMARQDAPLFARYNMARRSRYTELNTGSAQFNAMTFVDGVLYAGRTAQNDRMASIETTTGTVVSTAPAASPAASIQDLSWITPEFTTPTTRYYASDRGSNLYQIDPASGETSVLASIAPLTAEAVAYDLSNDYIYFLERPGAGFRLARYDADSGAATVLGSLQQNGFAYVPADQPRSMVFYNGQIYYIARNTDDLVQVTVTGGAITAQVKVRDLSQNVSSWDVAAMSLNNSGQLFFRTGSTLYRCDLRASGGSLTTLTSSSPEYESLLFTEDSSALYGATAVSLTRADSVNISNGTATNGVVTSPAVSLYEMTGPNSAAAPPTPYYYAANSTNKLYRVDPVSGNTVAISGTAPYTFDTVAYDQSAGVVYYVQNTDSSARLGKYTIATGAFANIGTIVDTSIGGLTIGVHPLHLVAYQGALYYIRRYESASSQRDDLIRITFTSTGAIATQAKVADIGNTSLADVRGATVDDSGMMYFNTNTALYRYNLRELNGYTVLKSSFQQQNGLLWMRDGSQLYGAPNSAPTGINAINMSNWALEAVVTTNPTAITMSDFASGNLAPPPPWNSVPPVYIAGDFSRTSNGALRNVARLGPDGEIDNSFNTGSGTNSGSSVRAMTRTSSGQLVIGGDFTSFNGTSRAALARLNGNGSLDTSFTPEISQAPGGTSGTAYTADWSVLGLNQDVSLNGTDTNVASISSPLHGMSTSGGFAGFGYQTFNNVANSGVTMTAYFSQNMTEAGGVLDGSLNGPNLFGPSGSGANGGIHPDRRIVGPWSERFNNDQVGTLTPTTIGFSFSEPVFLNQLLIGHLSKMAGAASSFGANILTNGSFESGSWSTTGYIPNSSHASRAPAKLNISGSGHISSWTPDGAHWVESSSRATDGNRFLYIKPSDQSWNFCVGQTLSVGGEGSTSRKLITGRTYRVRYSSVTFNPNRPTGVGATEGKPAVEYGWTKPDGSNGFSELQNVREDSTGLPASMLPATNWDAIQWRHYTGYFVAPATSSSNYNLTLWLSMVKVDGSTASDTSGMLFDNVRLEEVTATENAYEHAFVRAFSTADATGAPVAADSFENLSSMTSNLLGSNSDPTTTADVNNVRMDDDSSSNIYHCIGMGGESENRYGRVRISYAGQPIRSVAISFWASAETELVGASTLPRFDGALTRAGVTASLSNMVFRRAAALPGSVWAVAEQPDGKILIGGNFSTVNGVARNNIARLNTNGSLDTSFDPGTGPNGDVRALEILADGSILAGGDFSTWNGSSAGSKIVLLSASGARNTGWTSSLSATAGDSVRWIKAVSGGVLVGGKFSAPRNGIARLTMAGANDTSFNPGTGVGTATVHSGFILDDGKIMIGGDFTSFNGTTRNRIARLNTSGSLDTSFAPSPAFDGVVHSLLRLPGSGYVHAGGAFGTYNSNARARVTVFNSVNGAAGTTVWGPTGMSMNAVYCVD